MIGSYNLKSKSVLNYDDFLIAIMQGDIDSVNRALEVRESWGGMYVHDNNNLAFIEAAARGHLEIMNRLLELETVRKRVTAWENQALGFAAKNGHLHVVNRLLEIDAVRAYVTADNNYALRMSARNGHLPVVNRLLELEEVYQQAAADGNFALRMAVENGSHAAAARLLQIPSVSAYLKQHQQAYIAEHQAFFNNLENQRRGRIFAVKFLSEQGFHDSSVKHILGFAYHDVLCGKPECLKIKEGNAEGLISCHIVTQFRTKTVEMLARAKPSSESSNSTYQRDPDEDVDDKVEQSRAKRRK